MRRRLFPLLVLALLFASSSAIADEELPRRSEPSFLDRLWDGLVELLPLSALSELPADPGPAPLSSSDPDRGLGLDPNG